MLLRTLITRLLLLAGLLSITALGDGTFNANNNFTPTGTSQKAFVLDLDGSPLKADRGRVEILVLDGLQSLGPKGVAGEALTLDGLFFVNGLSVASAGVGDSVDLIIRAWDASTGDTYAQALAKAETLVRVTNLGGGLTPPATLGGNSNFRGLRLQFTPY